MRGREAFEAYAHALAMAAWASAAALAGMAEAAASLGYGEARVRLCCAWVEGAWGAASYGPAEAGVVAGLLLSAAFLAIVLRAALRALGAPWWGPTAALGVEAAALSMLSAFIVDYVHTAASIAASVKAVNVGVGVVRLEHGGAEAAPPYLAAAIPPALAVAAAALEVHAPEPRAPPGGGGGRVLRGGLAVAGVASLAALTIAAALVRVPVQAPPPPEAGRAVFDGWRLMVPEDLLGGRLGPVECRLTPPLGACNVTRVGGWVIVSPPESLKKRASLTGEPVVVSMEVRARIEGVAGTYEALVVAVARPVEPSWTLEYTRDGALTFRLGPGYPQEGIRWILVHWLDDAGGGFRVVAVDKLDGPLTAALLNAPPEADAARVYVAYAYAGEERVWATYIRPGQEVTGPNPGAASGGGAG